MPYFTICSFKFSHVAHSNTLPRPAPPIGAHAETPDSQPPRSKNPGFDPG